MNKDKLKGFISGVIVMALMFSMTATGFASVGSKTITAAYNNIKIYVNQSLVDLKDASGNTVEPFIYNGTTYLPLRAVADALGQEVTWDNATKSVYLGSKPSPLPSAPFTLGAGQYIVGVDIPIGKYQCTATAGSGNFIGTVKSLGYMGLNEILGAPGSVFESSQTFDNLTLTNGDSIKVSGDLKVKFELK